MRRLVPIVAFALGLTLASSPELQAQGSWLAGIEDLPLMPGLIERAEKSVVFDKPGGRIVDAEAIGRVEAAAAEKFYADTLPALGWARTGPGAYRREGEALRLFFGREGGALTIRFTINPENPG